MEVQITNVNRSGARSHVDFTSEYGVCRAEWQGPVPEPHARLHAELDAGECELVTSASDGRPSLSLDGQVALLCGQAELIEDGITYLRVGTDLIQCEGLDVSVGEWVCLRTGNLTACDEFL
jgi:hypothetical protein